MKTELGIRKDRVEIGFEFSCTYIIFFACSLLTTMVTIGSGVETSKLVKLSSKQVNRKLGRQHGLAI